MADVGYNSLLQEDLYHDTSFLVVEIDEKNVVEVVVDDNH